jgi:hypothetical protein
MRSEDHLTYKLGDIIKASGDVRQGAPAHVITEFEQLLQVWFDRVYFTSESREAPLTFFLYSSTLRHTWTTSLQAFPRHSRSPGDL